jgi:lipopolysaccharide transport system ATP-binding protein
MDEWLSVGDAEFVDKAKRRLTDMVNNARLVVIASHDAAMIKEQCRTILKLEHGKIVSIQKS